MLVGHISAFPLPTTLMLMPSDTRLADRTAALEAQKAASQPVTDVNAAVVKTPGFSKSTAKDAALDSGSAQLKIDLAEALRAKGQLQSRLKIAEEELERNKTKMKADTRLIKELFSDRAALAIKVKDRDEELKGKAKLLEVSLFWASTSVNVFAESMI